MILDDLIDIASLETKQEKAEEIDRLIKAGNERIIRYIFDDMIKFNIAVNKIRELRFRIRPEEVTNSQLDLLLTKIVNKEFTGNAAINACVNFSNKLDNDQFDMFCDILQSNPRVGINITDLNKRCELFKIPQFKVHLCKSYKDVKGKLAFTRDWLIQPKIDGNRIIGIKDITTKLYSRKGHARESLNHIIEILNKYNKDIVFDGEVEFKDSLEATGAIRRKTKQAKEAIYTIFGMYELDQWREESHTDEYYICYKRAKDFVNSLPIEDQKYVKVIESTMLGSFNSEEEMMQVVSEYYEKYLLQGYEGAVFKANDHMYVPSSGSKRSAFTIKIKPWIDLEAIVVGFKESEKNPDTLGSFMAIDAEGNEFDIAPGHFLESELEYIWRKQHKFIDKTISFKCQGRTIYNKPRHPIAIAFRDDV